MDKLKIAVLTSSYPRYTGDGTAPFIMAFCEGLQRAGHDIAVAAPFDIEVRNQAQSQVAVQRFKYIWPEKFHIMGHARALRADVKLRPLSYLLLPFYLLSAFFTLFRMTRIQRTDLVHVHWVLPNGLAAAWIAGIRRIPYVVSLHGSDVYLAKSNPIFRVIAKYIFRQASGVTACSPELLEAAREMDAPEHSILLPYGVDTQKFHPGNRGEHTLRQYSTGQAEVALITLGRLVYKKGFDLLIAAARELEEASSNVNVVIGGDGPLQNDLQQKINDMGLTNQVRLAGNIPWDEVPKFLASGDVFVLPSIRDQHGNIDGLPNVLLEAMSSGTPVIASDIPGVKTVIEDSINGVLVPSGDLNRLVSAIMMLAGDQTLRENLGKSARKSIEDNYTWDAIIKRLVELFKVVLYVKD